MRVGEQPFQELAHCAGAGRPATSVRWRGVSISVWFFLLGLIALAGPIGTAQGATAHVLKSSFIVDPGGTPESVTPASIAVDEESGSVYVLTYIELGFIEGEFRSEFKIFKYDAAGNPSNFSVLGTNAIKPECTAIYTCRHIAVDNSGGPNQGVIYLSQTSFGVGNAKVEVFLPTGAPVGPLTNRSDALGPTPFCGVAVDDDGNVYVSHAGNNANLSIVDRYAAADWALNPIQTPPITGTIAPLGVFGACKIAVDSSGAVYVMPGSEFQSETASISRFGIDDFGREKPSAELVDQSSTYLAIDQSNDDLYSDHGNHILRLAGNNRDFLESFGGAPQLTNSLGVTVRSDTDVVYASNRETKEVSIYDAVTTPDASVGPVDQTTTTAQLTGSVDPLGAGNITQCYFEYGLVSVTTPSAATFPSTAPCTPAAPLSSATPVSTEISGLYAGLRYRLRLVAENANGTTVSRSRIFTTLRAPSIDGAYVSDLTSTSAVLNARINPNGAETKYHFEYGPTTEYGSVAPNPDQSVGDGETPEIVSLPLTGLVPRTVYYFRVVATNSEGTTVGQNQSFNFYPARCPNARVRQQTGSDHVPDCRAYELVSPASAGNVILTAGQVPVASRATNPARFAMQGGRGAITGEDAPNGSLTDSYVATRTPTGWFTKHVGIPGSQTPAASVIFGYLGLDRFVNFKDAVISGNVPQPPSNAPYAWDATGKSLGRWPADVTTIPEGDSVHGAFQPSPDFNHMAFSSNNLVFDRAKEGLTVAPGTAYDYEPATGDITIVSRLPNGQPIPQEADATENTTEFIRFPGGQLNFQQFPPATARPARINPSVSRDGSHILMSTQSTESTASAVRLYMRVTSGVPITYDVTRGQYVTYIGMTADGSDVFFTATGKLTEDDHDTSIDLFRWSEEGDTLTRLSVGTGGTGDTDVCPPSFTSKCNVVRVSGGPVDSIFATDNGDIYFYSAEQLAGPEYGAKGARNLYVSRNGEVKFVAIGALSRLQVSPDGRHAAFVSPNALTAVDTAGLEQMYSYDALTGEIICVSCKPTGEQPTANVEGSKNGLFMSDDGRTFFATVEALVPEDTNDGEDIYEYVDGRAQLITTGTGAPPKTGLAVASTGLGGVSGDGINVYFFSWDSLVPQDLNGFSPKVYNARTNGGFLIDPPIAPCEAADECHGPGGSVPPPPAVVSDVDLGQAGNEKGGGASKQRKRRAKKHRGKRRDKGARKKPGSSNGKRGGAR